MHRDEVLLTPDRQVINVHLVPVVILYSINKGVPFGLVQVDFTVVFLHYFLCRDHNETLFSCRRGKKNIPKYRVKKTKMSVFSSVHVSLADEGYGTSEYL